MSVARLVALIGRLPPRYSLTIARCREHAGDWIVAVSVGPATIAYGQADSVDASADLARGQILPFLRDEAEREHVSIEHADTVETLVEAAISRCSVKSTGP